MRSKASVPSAFIHSGKEALKWSYILVWAQRGALNSLAWTVVFDNALGSIITSHVQYRTRARARRRAHVPSGTRIHRGATDRTWTHSFITPNASALNFSSNIYCIPETFLNTDNFFNLVQWSSCAMKIHLIHNRRLRSYLTYNKQR